MVGSAFAIAHEISQNLGIGVNVTPLGFPDFTEHLYNGYAASVFICYGPNCGRIFDRIVTVEILGSVAG